MVALLPRGLAGTKKGLDCLPAQTQFATLQIGLIGMQKASFFSLCCCTDNNAEVSPLCLRL